MVFGGIVQHIAEVVMVTKHRMRATVPSDVMKVSGIGESVAFNGVCLTVIERDEQANALTFDLSDETLQRTTFGGLTAPRKMHVEPALRLGDAIGGHVISGHVHGVGQLISLDVNSGELVIKLPKETFRTRPIFKDSVAIDGVSLTVAKIHPETDSIGIALIPHTIKLTLFATYSAGSPVNIELNMATLQREVIDSTEASTTVKDDEFWMKAALREAAKGTYTAAPNPTVGAVLVDPWNSLIGTGYHHRPGEAHAERCITAPMGGCTLYVTLEPCSHHGRTPPCVEYLIEQRPARVVIGTLDPDVRVSGSGVKALREAGISVTVGVLEDQVKYQLRAYLYHRTHGNRPYVVCKLALSQDSCYAYTTDTDTQRQWITGEAARRHGHGERARSQRVVVGKNTDIMDKPRLDVRYDYPIDKQPERVVSTRDLKWLEPSPDVLQILVEGGPELEDDLLSKGLVNEFVLYRSTKFLGLHGIRWNPSFEVGDWSLTETVTFDDGDTMQRFVRVSHNTFTPTTAMPATTAQTPTATANQAPIQFDSIDVALHALRRGEPIVVMDDENRENEGDLMLLADRLNLRSMKTLLALTTGIVCATMTKARAQQLSLPLMVNDKENNESHRTKFTLSVDAAHGITTGVSANDRLVTLSLLAKGTTKPNELVRPGHVFPLIAAAGGLLERRGHTEAGVELARMVGGMEHCVMVISELYDKNTGRMMNAWQCRQLGFPMIHIEGLVQRISKWALWASVPLQPHPGNWHVAVVAGCRVVACGDAISAYSPGVASVVDSSISPPAPSGIPATAKQTIALRIHSECFTGDVLGSSLCDCGNQLHAALRAFGSSPQGGVIVFPPDHEGRGIGLAEKLKAYSLQRDHGLDTFEANQVLGHARDERNYESAVFALKHIGVLPATHRLQLYSENPAKVQTLRDAGYDAEVHPLKAIPTEHNAKYLTDKRHEFNTIAHQMNCSPPPTVQSPSTSIATPPNVAFDASANQSMLMKQAPAVTSLSADQRAALGSVNVVVVQAEWHRHMTDPLVASIQSELSKKYNILNVRRVLAPGSFELPRVIAHLASKAASNAPITVYIAVGVLVKGDTDHYDLVARETTASIQRLSLDKNLWIVNSVLACHTMRQVEERCIESFDKCVAPHMAQAAARLALLGAGFD